MIKLKIETNPDNDKAYIINEFAGSIPVLFAEYCTLYMNFIRAINKKTDIPIKILYAAIDSAMKARIDDITENKEVLN